MSHPEIGQLAIVRKRPFVVTEIIPSAPGLGLDAAGVRAWLQGALEKLHAKSTGSSTAPARLLVLDEPPSIDANEITDKGYIDQRARLERRSAQVARLHAVGPGVILAALVKAS